MKVLIDANVLISVLNKEYPVFSNSSRILSLAGQRGFELFVTPLTLAIAFYFSTKKSGEVLAKKKLQAVSEHLKIAIVDDAAVKSALANKSIQDFEDGMQYYAAMQVGCECIVTEDAEGFYYSEIEVRNCERFLKTYVFDL